MNTTQNPHGLVGHLSTFKIVPIRILTVALLSSLLPAVKADCYIDSAGYEICNGLSDPARIGIGIAFFFAFLALLTGLLFYRRRRTAQANLIYTQQAQHHGAGGVYGSPYDRGDLGPFAPQYPPPAHNGVGSPYAYDPSTGFASPVASPPQYYPPPPGSPIVTPFRK
ncbi:hypothetical protein F5148DRAFT_483026 [Russula earlei]|uniref:Uncharacterized protein n=1 Tax=Russula earlei TaxID=71964 RepID=A0ACC0TZF9_9AGAM|nr:hypothetical protein F5148DRAFT_483026 [Russula earlei]